MNHFKMILTVAVLAVAVGAAPERAQANNGDPVLRLLNGLFLDGQRAVRGDYRAGRWNDDDDDGYRRGWNDDDDDGGRRGGGRERDDDDD